ATGLVDLAYRQLGGGGHRRVRDGQVTGVRQQLTELGRSAAAPGHGGAGPLCRGRRRGAPRATARAQELRLALVELLVGPEVQGGVRGRGRLTGVGEPASGEGDAAELDVLAVASQAEADGDRVAALTVVRDPDDLLGDLRRRG